MIRGNTGANASSGIYHRGTGNLEIQTTDSSSMLLRTNNTTALTLNASQNATFAGNITVTGTSSTFNTGNSGTFVTNDGVSGGYPRITTTSSSAQLGLFRASDGGFYIGADSSKFRIFNSAFSEKFSVDTAGDVSATTFSGDLNGTINTATTAVTQADAVDNETVATTAYVNNKIQLIPAGLIFQGTWNAATNTPTLTSGSGTTGHFYIVSVSGNTNLDGITDWKVGDWAVFIEQGLNDQWEKSITHLY